MKSVLPKTLCCGLRRDDLRRRCGTALIAAIVIVSPVAAYPPDPAPEALALLRANRFEEAAGAFQRVVEEHPYDSAMWRRLGQSLHGAGRYDEAVSVWHRAIELGDGAAANMYNICCSLSLAGRGDEALDWLERSLEAGFTEDELIGRDTDLNSIRGHPRFAQITGSPPPAGLSRDEQWRYDLDFFARRMRQMHFDLHRKISREEFAAEVESLKADIPSLKDGQVRARLRRILARVGDGHTLLSAVKPGAETIVRMPLDLYMFIDGLHVRGAPREHDALVGARVTRLGAVDVDEALRRFRAYVSVDNAMGYRDWAGAALASPDILEAIGALNGDGALDLTVITPEGEERQERIVARESSLADLRRGAISGFRYAAAESPTPLYARRPGDSLWFERLPEHEAVYFWFGQVGDAPDRSFEQVCDEVFGLVESSGARRLVIDMRTNSGGNSGLLMPLLHGLIRCEQVNQPGRLFVIIGRRTFSAAMNATTLIEAHTHATFVGEPTGSSPRFVGESTSFVLPCTGYRVYCSSRQWQHLSSTDERTWIAPQIVAEMSAADYRSGRDPAMEAIIARWSQERSRAGNDAKGANAGARPG